MNPMSLTDAQILESYFTDVEDIRELFSQTVSSPVLTHRILVIHGLGGVGKSALLRMFRLHCKRVHVPVALASGDESKSAIQVLGVWANDLRIDRLNLGTFAKTLKRLRSVQARVQAQARGVQNGRDGTIDMTGKAVVKSAEAAASTVVGAMLGSAIPGIGTLAGALGGLGAEALAGWLGGFLGKADVALLLDPIMELTRNLLYDLNRIAAQRRIVLILDTFEQLTALDMWVCGLVQQLDPNILFVIAGRGMVNWDRYWPEWLAYASVQELRPMSASDLSILVHRYYATIHKGEPDPVQVEAIVHFARGLPIVVTSIVRLWVKYGWVDFPTLKREVVADMVDCLMEGVPPHLLPVLESAAVLRYFDASLLHDLLAVSVQPTDVYTVYESGLARLRARIGHDHSHFGEVLTYQQRLLENIARVRRYGDDPAHQANRAEIVQRLDALALAVLGTNFSAGLRELEPWAQTCGVTSLPVPVDADALYDELRRWPFVRPQREGLALHSTVRELLDESLRERNPKRHFDLHERAAASCEARIANAGDEEAQKLAQERIYHHIRMHETQGMQIFQQVAEELSRFRLLHLLRTLLNDAHTYPLESENSQLWRQYYQARLLHFEAKLDEAATLYEAVGRSRQSESRLRAYALCDWGEILARYERLGQPGGTENARQVLDESLASGFLDAHLTTSLLSLAHVAGFQGHWAEQSAYLERARRFLEQEQDYYGLAHAFESIQRAQARHGAWRDVFWANEQGLAALSRTQVRSGDLEARLRGKWVWAWALAGRLSECERNGLAALVMTRDLGDEIATLQILRDVAWAIASQGRFQEATPYFRESLDIARRLDLIYEQGATLGFWGAALTWNGLFAEARCRLTESLRIKEALRETPGMLEPVSWLGRLYEQLGELETAACYYERYTELEWYGRMYFECSALTGLARVRYALGDSESAARLAAEAETLAQGNEYYDHLAALRLMQGHAVWDGQVPAWGSGFMTARSYYQQALVYALRYNRFLLDEILSGGPLGSLWQPIITRCKAQGEEGRHLLNLLADWWCTATNDAVPVPAETISLFTQEICLVDAETIARQREPGRGETQRTLFEQIQDALQQD